ncbi:hypothetical protein STIAU_7797 [Stigmatella aurantiaca DW4/3-1]|uniref:Uncharacterized protein n=1 Tax=Stigmatella aurantiaca (strain DW4/3-1) TaxID=378806 RepID=Q08RS3_STIAD|nr:hypothetical protein STIAU_7797 [Stigmatella aurantiaca DW4/3-1]
MPQDAPPLGEVEREERQRRHAQQRPHAPAPTSQCPERRRQAGPPHQGHGQRHQELHRALNVQLTPAGRQARNLVRHPEENEPQQEQRQPQAHHPEVLHHEGEHSAPLVRERHILRRCLDQRKPAVERHQGRAKLLHALWLLGLEEEQPPRPVLQALGAHLLALAKSVEPFGHPDDRQVFPSLQVDGDGLDFRRDALGQQAHRLLLLPVRPCSLEKRQHLDGRPHLHEGLAAKDVFLLVGETHRDDAHRGALARRPQGDPRGPRLQLRQRGLRVAPPLGKQGDGPPLNERRPRRIQRPLVLRHQGGMVLLAVDGQCVQPLEDPPDHRHPEERLLGQKGDVAAGEDEDERRINEAVGVVAHEDERPLEAGGRSMHLHPVEKPQRQGHQTTDERVEHGRDCTPSRGSASRASCSGEAIHHQDDTPGILDHGRPPLGSWVGDDPLAVLVPAGIQQHPAEGNLVEIPDLAVLVIPDVGAVIPSEDAVVGHVQVARDADILEFALLHLGDRHHEPALVAGRARPVLRLVHDDGDAVSQQQPHLPHLLGGLLWALHLRGHPGRALGHRHGRLRADAPGALPESPGGSENQRDATAPGHACGLLRRHQC